jgi:hypothetical protein
MRAMGQGQERERHFLFPMSQMGAKTKNGGPHLLTVIMRNWGNTRGSKIMGVGA